MNTIFRNFEFCLEALSLFMAAAGTATSLSGAAAGALTELAQVGYERTRRKVRYLAMRFAAKEAPADRLVQRVVPTRILGRRDKVTPGVEEPGRVGAAAGGAGQPREVAQRAVGHTQDEVRTEPDQGGRRQGQDRDQPPHRVTHSPPGKEPPPLTA